MRTESPIEPLVLTDASAADVERRIVQGVRRYASHEANWARADTNTPFLGQVIGMGIESSNLVDITMSMERQFLTRKTVRVPLGEDGSAIRLEDGELGRLIVLDGEDVFAATPGLAVKMLMDGGHMPRDPGYLATVVSFPYVVIVGEGYRLHQALRRLITRVGRLDDERAREEAALNLKTLCEQAREYIALVNDPIALARARQEAFGREKQQVDVLQAELDVVAARVAEATVSGANDTLEELRSQQVPVRLRLNAARQRLRVAEEVARVSMDRSAIEEEKVQQVRHVLSELLMEAMVGAAADGVV